MPKEMRKVLTKVSKPVQRALKAAAPRDSGALRKSIATKIGVSKRTGSVYSVIGVRSRFATTSKGRVAKKGESFSKLPNRYAAVMEYGTQAFKKRRTSHIATKFREKTFFRTEKQTFVALVREVQLLLARGKLS